MKKFLAFPLMALFLVGLVSASDTFVISGSSQEQESMQVNLGENTISETLESTKIIDENVSDGHLLYLYGQYALINSTEDILVQQGSTQINSTTYNPEITYDFEETGEYKFGYGISYVEMEYDSETKSWQVIGSGMDVQDSVDITAVYPNPAEQDGLLDSIVTSLNLAWSNFIDWLIGLF